MRIGLATARDPNSRLTWSGTPSFMADALRRQGADVVPLGPINDPLELPVRAFNKLSGKLVRRRISNSHLIPLAKVYGQRLKDKAVQEDVDLVFSPAGSQLLAYADLPMPVVYSSDTTFALMTGYYDTFSQLYEFSRAHGNEIEARAIARADLILYPSEWAADSAVKDYGADRGKVRVLPYGANFTAVPEAKDVSQRDLGDTGVRLLFVGVDWKRKGGDTAVGTMTALKARGFPASLTVCGCAPPASARTEGVAVVPFLHKTDPDGAAQLARLYAEHDLLLFPTYKEAYGIVVAEASGFALPTLARATGGVAGVLQHGVNGYLLPESADGEAYADTVAQLVDDPARYTALCRSSRSLYERTLNWDVWAAEAIAEMAHLTGMSRAAAS
jgi:glycosyltransferase involved in cell wall biosynthesis